MNNNDDHTPNTSGNVKMWGPFKATTAFPAVVMIVLFFFLLVWWNDHREEIPETTTAAAICTDLNGVEMANAQAILVDGKPLAYAFDLNGSRVKIFSPQAGVALAGPFHGGYPAFHLYRCSVTT